MTNRPIRAFAFLLLSAAAAGQPMLLHTERGSYDPLAAHAAQRTAAGAPVSAAGFRYMLVQLEAKSEADLLRAAGAEFLGPVPANGHVVRFPAAARADAALAAVRWAAPLDASWRTEAALESASRGTAGTLRILVTVWRGEDRSLVSAEIGRLGGKVASEPRAVYRQIIFAELPAAALADLAEVPAVQWIERWPEPTLRNNTETWVLQSGAENQRPVWDRGIRGEGEIIGHIDDTLDIASCFLEDPANNTPGPGHRKVVAQRGVRAVDTHGTHTAGILAGRRIDSLDQAGHAHEARISHDGLTALFPGLNQDLPRNQTDLGGVLQDEQEDGAFIHSNSWGEDLRTNYTYFCAAIDEFMYANEDSLVVFAATNRTTLYTPENARNVLAVGNHRQWPNIGLHSTGGTGPTADGRRKPEVYATGQSVVSAVTTFTGNTCPTGQLTGTSMATPAVAGAAALVRQYFREGWYPTGTKQTFDGVTPSGALMKAMILNATVDMDGVPGYPLNLEGWGRLVLDRSLYFDGDARGLFVRDAKRTRGAGIAEGERSTDYLIVDGADELRATLAWSDPALAHNAALIAVNDLNLVVTAPDGTQYFGNSFADGFSTPGGEPDALNNVEQVAIQLPVPGAWRFEVVAAGVDAVAETVGFALVVSGPVRPTGDAGRIAFAKGVYACGQSAQVTLVDANLGSATAQVAIETRRGDAETLVLAPAGDGLHAASIAIADAAPQPGNGVLEADPDDTISAEYSDSDPGAGPATATASARVDCVPPEASNFRALLLTPWYARAAVDVSEPVKASLVQFDEVNGTPPMVVSLEGTDAGTSGTAELDRLTSDTLYRWAVSMTDNAGNQAVDTNGGAGYTFRTQRPIPVLETGFDAGAAGFISDNAAGSEPWSIVGEDKYLRSAPNAAFAKNAPAAQDARLVSPAVALPAGAPLLAFWHTYEFEPDTEAIGWDGGVLELKVEASSDWIDIGDRIVEGGYSGIIRENEASPLSTRPAFVNGRLGPPRIVVADLSPWAGLPVQVRWRLGSDAFSAAQGWFVDDVFIGLWQQPEATPTPTPTPIPFTGNGWLLFTR